MQKVKLKQQYVQIPNETAKAVEAKNNENPISLAALGLLTNLWSYDVETWELHKTELYKRYAKNKRTVVSNAWDELIEAKFIIEFKYKNGRSWEYVYYYRSEPFSDEEIKEIMLESVGIYGVESTADFQQLKFNSRKTAVENQHISNKKQSNTNKQNKNKQIKEEEEEERARAEENFEINNFAFENFVKEFQTHMPNYFDNEAYNRIYQEMISQKVSFITVAEAIEQVRKMNSRKETLPPIGDWFNYFVRGIQMNRTSKTNAVAAEKFRKGLAEQKTRDQQEKANDSREPLPFYNWLDQD